MPSRAKDVAYEEEFQNAAAKALEACYLVAKSSYGPKAGVAWIENTYGDPLVSRDGVTNLDSLHLADPVENMVARGAIQASKQSNKQVGDGTTAVVILTYHLYKAARKLMAGGYNRMEVETMLNNLAEDVDNYITKLKVKATPKLLQAVARVSSGDPALGDLIAETLNTIGPDGGVTIEDYLGDGIYPEMTTGFYWPKGYSSVQLINDTASLESRFDEVPILVTEKRLATSSDIAPILDKIVGAKINNLVIVGTVEPEAMAVLATLRLQGMLTCTPVDVPTFGGNRSLMLDDLALITEAEVLLPGTNSSDFEVKMLGGAARVVITESSTSIIGREATDEAVEQRVKELSDQYETTKSSSDKEAIRSRIGRLRGAMAILHVGGATEIEQREAKLRVQDAVCAIQAANEGGVVPGGGVTLALAPITEAFFEETLQAPFKDLASNAGLNAEKLLGQLSSKTPWQGFDMKDGLEYDLKTRGIVDPAAVVHEIVRNATSVVSKIITGTVAITYQDREARRE